MEAGILVCMSLRVAFWSAGGGGKEEPQGLKVLVRGLMKEGALHILAARSPYASGTATHTDAPSHDPANEAQVLEPTIRVLRLTCP